MVEQLGGVGKVFEEDGVRYGLEVWELSGVVLKAGTEGENDLGCVRLVEWYGLCYRLDWRSRERIIGVDKLKVVGVM